MISFPAYLFSCALEGKSSMFNYFGMLILYSKYVRSVVKEKTNKFVSIGGNWNDFFGQINEEKSWASFLFTVSYIGLPIFLSFFLFQKTCTKKIAREEEKPYYYYRYQIQLHSISFFSKQSLHASEQNMQDEKVAGFVFSTYSLCTNINLYRFIIR